MVSSAPATTGRNARLWTARGVTTSASQVGWTMGPPALTLYAVLPVGVETMRPSPERWGPPCPLKSSPSSIIRNGAPAVTTQSLRASVQPSSSSRSSSGDSTRISRVIRSTIGGASPSTSSAASANASASNSARNPSRPTFTPAIGVPRAARRRACPRIVPSPPSTTATSNGVSGSGSCGSIRVTSPACRSIAGSTIESVSGIPDRVRSATSSTWGRALTRRCPW